LGLALSKKGGQQSQNFLSHNAEIPILALGREALTVRATICEILDGWWCVKKNKKGEGSRHDNISEASERRKKSAH